MISIYIILKPKLYDKYYIFKQISLQPPRPPLPYERSQTPRTPSPGRHQSLPPPSSKWRSTPSPKFQSIRSSSTHLSISRKLAKESSAMQTLSSFRSHDRPLPPLEPFPFVPHQDFSVKRKIPVDKGMKIRVVALKIFKKKLNMANGEIVHAYMYYLQPAMRCPK